VPSGINDPVYIAALFRVREMREDHFLNHSNSGNRDREAKETKAEEVV